MPTLRRLPSSGYLEQHKAHGFARAEGSLHAFPIPVHSKQGTSKLSIHQERFKSFHAKGQEHTCMRLPQHSGGFKATSTWCTACPLQASCKALT